MQNENALVRAWAPRMLSLLRIVVGLLYVEHGTAKLLGFPAGAGPEHLQVFTLIWFAGILELVGGSLLVLGLFTRLVAFILAGEMAIGYFMAHAPHSVFPLLNHGEAAVFYCWVFLYFAVAGGGAWSVDRLRTGRRAAMAALS